MIDNVTFESTSNGLVFWEQVTLAYESGRMPRKLLTGRTARVVVTMGMPAFIYRWYFGAHGLKGLTGGILAFSGIGPIKQNLIGMVEGMDGATRARWLERMHRLGREGK